MPLGGILGEKLRTGSTGFGGVRPTDFGDTAASPTSMPAPMAPGDPRRNPWPKGGGGGHPLPTPAPTPEPEPRPPTFFERFPTPQEAWKDWLDRMGQFLARQPGETPNFPGLWGTAGEPTSRVPDRARQLQEEFRENIDLKGRQRETYPTPFEGVKVF